MVMRKKLENETITLMERDYGVDFNNVDSHYIYHHLGDCMRYMDKADDMGSIEHCIENLRVLFSDMEPGFK